MNKTYNKIFGIGLSHTATKSLNEALEILDIKSIHYPTDRQTYLELSQGKYDLTLLKKYDAITDITTVPYFIQLDRAYPGSKFVLTMRDKELWMNSMRKRNKTWVLYANQNFFVKYARRFKEDWNIYNKGAFKSTWFRITHDYIGEYYRIATYGGLSFEDDRRLSDVYDLHHKTVLEYFKDRPQDLLIIDITKGEGWDKLCTFLSMNVPAKPFPYIFEKRFHMKAAAAK